MIDAPAMTRMGLAFAKLARAADELCSVLLTATNDTADAISKALKEAVAEELDKRAKQLGPELVPPETTVKPWQRRTPERVALLKELWVNGNISKDELLARINALPGDAIPRSQLSSYAAQWGAARPRRFSARAIAEAEQIEASPLPTPSDLVAPITAANALEWAMRNLPPGFDPPRTLNDLNAIRRHYGLPLFRIIRPTGPHAPLPDKYLDVDGIHSHRAETIQ